MKGLKKSIRYSIKPHLLGLCGPKEKESRQILTDFLLGKKTNEQEIINLYKQFKSVIAYLGLIAECNGIKNPFDEKVVEAYWIGNDLLKKVPHQKLEQAVSELLQRKVEFPKGVLAHHSFHVLFVGSLKNIAPIEKLIPHCVINYGVVKQKGLEYLIVQTKPLIIDAGKIKLGNLVLQKIDFNPQILPKVELGDIVSYHWSAACEILSRKQAKNLKKYLKRNINAYNRVG